MNTTRLIAKRLGNGSREARTAFATYCSMRTSIVFNEYWIGDHTPLLNRAIELGIQSSQGAEIDEREADMCIDELDRFIEYYHEAGVSILASTVTIARRVLECIIRKYDGDISLSASRACGSSLFVCNIVDGLIEKSFPDLGKIATQEEKYWQDRSIAVVEHWKGIAQTDMFDQSGPTPPKWWEHYRAAERHI